MISVENFYDYLTDNHDSYVLIKNFLSQDDLEACLNIAKNLRHTDEDEHYEARLFDPKKAFGEDHFFSQIDVQRLGEIYGLDSVDYFQWEIARDDPSFQNEFHTDVKHTKNTVTIQWYLDMDDPSRKLYISSHNHLPFEEWDESPNVQLLDTTPNSMVAFLAKPNTNHGFKSGEGHRYNVRLRFMEFLNKPQLIHNRSTDDKICWWIESKDMEVESYPHDGQDFYEEEDSTVEQSLSRFTYDCLTSHKQSNILVNDKIRQYPKTLQYLKDQGFEKCVIVFAGSCVTDKTVDFVKNQTNDYPVYGQVFDEFNCLLRRLVVLDLTKIDVSKADGFDNYLSAYMDNFKEINVEKDTGCLYVHPEENTYRALFDMARYHKTTFDGLRNTKNYPELKDHHRETIRKMLDYYLNTVLPNFPDVIAKTLTT